MHMRNSKVVWELHNDLDHTSEGEDFHKNQLKRERKFAKAIRKQEQKLKGRRLIMDMGSGACLTTDLFEEAKEEYNKRVEQKMSYDNAKANGLLWSKEKKAESKEAKRIARKEKRLANK